MPRTPSEKQERLFQWMKEQARELPQSEIIKHFFKEFGEPTEDGDSAYTNLQCARVSVGMMLSKLEKEGRIQKRKELNENKGGVMKNLWKVV